MKHAASSNSHEFEIFLKEAEEGGTLQTARMAAGISPQARAHFDNAIVKPFSYFFGRGSLLQAALHLSLHLSVRQSVSQLCVWDGMGNKLLTKMMRSFISAQSVLGL